MKTIQTVLAAALLASTPALADFNDKNPVTATVTGATPSGYPRTMVEGLNAVVRDANPGSAASTAWTAFICPSSSLPSSRIFSSSAWVWT